MATDRYLSEFTFFGPDQDQDLAKTMNDSEYSNFQVKPLLIHLDIDNYNKIPVLMAACDTIWNRCDGMFPHYPLKKRPRRSHA